LQFPGAVFPIYKVADYGYRDFFGPETFHRLLVTRGDTLAYTAPELRSHATAASLPMRVLVKADIYSFGVVVGLCTLLQAPRLPPSQPYLPGDFPATVPGWMIQSIMRCLDPSPDKRPTAADMKMLLLKGIVHTYSNSRTVLDELGT